MKWLGLVSVLVAGCAEKAQPPKTSTELRVPLPDGWVASGSSERLLAGPPGRPVVSFEPKLEPLPALDALLAAAGAQKASSIQGIQAPGFVGARYSLDSQEAFIGVKQVGARSVWCASLNGATEAEVVDALNACRETSPR